VLGALGWALHTLSLRSDRQQEMHFTEVLHDIAPQAAHAAADLKALGHEPANQEARAEYGRRLRTEIVPEWNQLYVTVDAAPVPAGTSAALLKERLLRYQSDLSQALLISANMDEHPELRTTDTRAQVKSLMDDASRELKAIRTGGGPL
jgi:hypothetical protein